MSGLEPDQKTKLKKQQEPAQGLEEVWSKSEPTQTSQVKTKQTNRFGSETSPNQPVQFYNIDSTINIDTI